MPHPLLTDEQRVEKLVQAYMTWAFKRMIRYFKRRNIPSKEWNELKQDGLIKLWRIAQKYVDQQPRKSFKVWAGCRLNSYFQSVKFRRRNVSEAKTRAAVEQRGAVEHDVIFDLLHQAMAKCYRLTARQREVLELKFGPEHMRLGDIGQKYGLSRERIRQIIKEALYKLQRVVLHELD